MKLPWIKSVPVQTVKQNPGSDVAVDLLVACELALNAMTKEWLYQTGQTVRPHAKYPPQGSVCGELSDAIPVLRAAIAKARGKK